jgi:hypothetical protein
MIPASLKRAIKAWWRSSDLPEDRAVFELAQVINSNVGVLRASAGFPMLRLTDERGKSGARLTDEERRFVELVGVNPARVAETIQREREAGKRHRKTATLSPEDLTLIRACGCDPLKVAAVMRGGGA